MKTKRPPLSGRITLPLAMFDLFALSLLFLISREPEFDLQHPNLPGVTIVDSQSATSRGAQSLLIRVAPDGQTFLQNQPVPLELLSARLRQELRPGQRITLLFDADNQGQGHVTTQWQLFYDLHAAGFGDRLDLLTKPRPQATPPAA